MPSSRCTLAVAATIAILAYAAHWSLPLVSRLWRLPQVLVHPAQKDPAALRIGILGASFIGQVALVFAAAKRHDVIVVAVAARDVERAAAFAARHSILSYHGGEQSYQQLQFTHKSA